MSGSANRDSRQFPEPGRFDLARNPNPHIAFDHAIHFCLGAQLSRLEARVAMPELLGRPAPLPAAPPLYRPGLIQPPGYGVISHPCSRRSRQPRFRS